MADSLNLGAPQVDLWGDAGSDIDFTVTLTTALGVAINLTGYSATCIVKFGYAEPTAAISISSSGAAPSTITITPLTGKIAVHIDHTNTATLTAPRAYVYDLTITNGTVTQRKLFGNLNARPQAS